MNLENTMLNEKKKSQFKGSRIVWAHFVKCPAQANAYRQEIDQQLLETRGKKELRVTTNGYEVTFCFFFLIKFLFLLYFTLQYCVGFAIHWHESTMGVHAFPNMNPLPPPTPYHLSGLFPCTSPKYAVSCIEHRLAIRFLHDSIHVSMPFSQIIPPSPSPSESKSPLYTSVSFLLSRIQGHHCHLSKFHIYALVYCIGVFLSGLLHSV